MTNIFYKEKITENSKLIEIELEKKLNTLKDDKNFDKVKNLFESMKYSLLSGGKRLRPLLVVEFAKLFGADFSQAKDYACAIEMIHVSSLIHDDLPCVDNDVMRRGKPTNHMVFGEATALFSGDALMALAFETICNSNLSCEKNLLAIKTLSKHTGSFGMLGGQQIDCENEGKLMDLDTLKILHSKKTGALIASSCTLGCIVAGKYENTPEFKDAFEYAMNIGMAFQIADDILDVCGDETKLGKPCGSDEKSQKNTFVSLVGIQRSKELELELCENAKNIIKKYENSEFLCCLADYMINRDH